MALEMQQHDADVVEWETIAELCPGEATRFQSVLERHDIDEFTFATSYWPKASTSVLAHHLRLQISGSPGGSGQEDALRAASEIVTAWKALQRAFAYATKVGPRSFLSLGIAYIYEDEDEESVGAYYTVDGSYQLSPAGRKFEEHLTRVPGVWSND